MPSVRINILAFPIHSIAHTAHRKKLKHIEDACVLAPL
jgi:hypothetical protein